jgi:hypothetical protein
MTDADGPAGSARGWVAASFGGWLFTLSLGVLLTHTPRLLRVPPVGRTPAAFLALMITAYGLALWGGNGLVAQAIHLSCVLTLALLIAFRLAHKGNRPHPGPLTALVGALVYAAGDAASLLAGAGLVPERFGEVVWEAGVQGYFLLLAAAATRWSRGEGLHKAGTNGATATLIHGWGLLLFSLILEMVARIGASAFLLFAAYGTRSLWVIWQMRRPRGCWPLLAQASPQASSLRAGFLWLLASSLYMLLNPLRHAGSPLPIMAVAFAWVVLSLASAPLFEALLGAAGRDRETVARGAVPAKAA